MPATEAPYRTWVWICFKVGALSFGSVSRVVLYEDEVVRKRKWFSEEEFREALTLAQIMPGPNLVNLAAAIGFRLFSFPRAVLALIPLLVPGAILAIVIALFVPLDRPWVAELFRGFAIGALFLMARFIWMLFKGLTAQTPTQIALGTSKRLTLKTRARYLLAAAGTTVLLLGAPILPTVFIGVAVCLAWEFAT